MNSNGQLRTSNPAQTYKCSECEEEKTKGYFFAEVLKDGPELWTCKKCNLEIDRYENSSAFLDSFAGLRGS